MNQEDNSGAQGRSLGRSAVIVSAAALGFGIWAASPALTGHAEPWDAQYPFYSLTSLIGGGILGFLSRAVVRRYVAAWLGQVVALAVLPGLDRGWLLLGVMTTAVRRRASATLLRVAPRSEVELFVTNHFKRMSEESPPQGQAGIEIQDAP